MKVKAFLSTVFSALVLAGGITTSAFAAGAPTYKSDTTTDFSVNTGASYTFKISAQNTTESPSFTLGSAGVFSSKLTGRNGNDYFYKITALGGNGASTGVYVSGVRVCVASISESSSKAAVAYPNYARPFNVEAIRQDMIAAGEARGMIYTPSFTITNVNTETGAGNANASYWMPGDTIDYDPRFDDPNDYDYTYWLHKNCMDAVTGIADQMQELEGQTATGARFNPIWIPKGNGEYLFYVLYG